MLFSYNLLQEFVQARLPSPKKLAKLLALHAFEVEGVEEKKNDFVLDISVLPQRSDCLSHQGMAREVSVLLQKPVLAFERKLLKVEKGRLKPLRVRFLAKNLVPRFSALLIQGVKVGASPQWLQERLEILGMNSINNVVDITNYVMAVAGQPLHAFDYDKIQGNTLTLTLSRKGEWIELLDGTKLSLPPGILVAKDARDLVDLVGIKGAKIAAIGAKTKNFILQAATLDAPYIYKAKKILGYTTDAANIYAHGLDPELTKPALEFALVLLERFGGARLVQVLDIFPKKPAKSVKRMLRLSYRTIEETLGMSLSPRFVRDTLELLGFGVNQTKGGLAIVVPSFRQDVTIPQDIVEEVGRLYGYENMKAAAAEASLLVPLRNEKLFWQDVLRDVLKGAGYSELYLYSFIGKDDLERLGYIPKEQAYLVELENPVSQDFQYLRSTLLDNLLKSVAFNSRGPREKEVRMFEIGKVFENAKSSLSPVRERLTLGAVFSSPEENQAFPALKGVVDILLSAMGIQGVWYDDFQPSPDKGRVSLWHLKKAAEIKVGDKEVGFLGAVSPLVLSKLKIGTIVYALELDLEKLIELAREEREYAPIPRFPSLRRDIALFVPQETKIEEVMNVMENAGGELVWDIDLFDLYEGEGVPEEKKNLAFHIEYQAQDRTLKGTEVDALQEKIIKALEENPEWEVRK